MRYLLFSIALVLAAAVLTACGKPAELAPAEPAPTPEAAAAFTPTPVVWEPMSKTADAFTGALTITPLEAAPAGDPAPLKIESATGLYFETQPLARDKAAAPKIDWASVLASEGLAAGAVEVHEAVRQEALASAPNGGLCGDQGVYALAIAKTQDAGGETLRIAAFGGNEWPPLAETALCGTFFYTRK